MFVSSPLRYLCTVLTSLSPRPERHTTIILSFSIVFAALIAYASACELSIAGIIPAIESAHALAHVFKMAQGEYKGKTIIMCLSGRGDKDVNTVQKYLNGEETNK